MSLQKKPAQAILFDLDGTLLDTAPDLGHALNHTRQTRNLEPLPLDQIRPAAGRGCRGLLKMGFDIEESHADYLPLSKILLAHYQEHLFDSTVFFANMEKVLEHLEERKIPWAIVTNKPKLYTEILVSKLPILQRAGCIVSGDTLENCKPHPAPVLHACKLLQKAPADCLYIGDSEIDIIASRAAGTPVIAALYGYISSDENPLNWKADGYIKDPLEIIEWVSE